MQGAAVRRDALRRPARPDRPRFVLLGNYGIYADRTRIKNTENTERKFR